LNAEKEHSSSLQRSLEEQAKIIRDLKENEVSNKRKSQAVLDATKKACDVLDGLEKRKRAKKFARMLPITWHFLRLS